MAKREAAPARAARPAAAAKRRPPFLLGILVGAMAVFVAVNRGGGGEEAGGKSMAIPTPSDWEALVLNLPEGTLRERALELVRSMPPAEADHSSMTSLLAEEGPGKRAAAAGLRARHPVVMIPGFITSGLEIWKGDACAQPFLRKRIWGSASMVGIMSMYTQCWLQHMELDGATGRERPGRAVRAVLGFSAADYVVGNYWVLAKLVAALNEIGYTSSDMWVAGYDWRPPFHELQRRDKYLSRIASHLEIQISEGGPKAVVVAHSMGCTLWHYFLHWVVSPRGGRRPPDWVERHVHAVVLVGGPMLGAPKVAMGALTGESGEFTVLSGRLGRLLNGIVSPARRRRLFRSMGAALSLLPMGGSAVWGEASASPISGGAPGAMLQERTGLEANASLRPIATVEGAVDMLRADSEQSLAAPDGEAGGRFRLWYDTGFLAGATPEEMDKLRDPPEAAWVNPLLTQLPFAPSLKVYCLYGIGLPTEVAYVVSRDEAAAQPPEELEKGDEVPFLIDRDAEAPDFQRGVFSTDGDQTVPLTSLGYTCESLWRRRSHNPASAEVTIREYRHNPDAAKGPLDAMRGGPESGGHVDILGNYAFLSDVLAIASGHADEEPLQSRYFSGIKDIARRIDERLGLPPLSTSDGS